MSEIKLTPEQKKVFAASGYVTDGDGHYWDSDWDEVQEWLHSSGDDAAKIYPVKKVHFKLTAYDLLSGLIGVLAERTSADEAFNNVLEQKAQLYLRFHSEDYDDEELWPWLAEKKLSFAFNVLMKLSQWILNRAIDDFNKSVERSDSFALLLPDQSLDCVVKYEGQDDD